MLYTACGFFFEMAGRRRENMAEHSNQLDPELLDILRCPLTRSRLRQDGDFLVSEVGGLAYPVRDGIPVMLVEEARLPTGVESLDAFKQRYADQIPPR
jgi:uncharacterized protein